MNIQKKKIVHHIATRATRLLCFREINVVP